MLYKTVCKTCGREDILPYFALCCRDYECESVHLTHEPVDKENQNGED